VGNKASPLQEVCTLPFLGADVLFRFLFELGAETLWSFCQKAADFAWKSGTLVTPVPCREGKLLNILHSGWTEKLQLIISTKLS